MSPAPDGRSMWEDTAPDAIVGPSLRGDRTVDVAIVGAGFTGLSTARHLIERFPDRRIAVLEARTVGAGASGRNGGMALHEVNGIPNDERELTQRLYRLTTETLDWIARVGVEAGAPAGFLRRDGSVVAHTEQQGAEAAHAEVERLQQWGLPLRWLDRAALGGVLRAEGVVGGVLDPTTGQLHGLAFLRALAGWLRAHGVEIFEQTPVLRVDQGPVHRVHTATGTVSAPFLVLGTNAWSPSLGFFRRGVFPLHSHLVATAPLPLADWAARGWGPIAGMYDDRARTAFASMTPDGRLVFGGGGNRAYDYHYGGPTEVPRPPEAQWAFVRGVLDRYLPGARDVALAHRWSGALAVTLDRRCGIGITGAHRNVGYGVGYSGHGVVMANLAGRVLCDLYSGERAAWAGLSFVDHVPGGVPPEPLRYVGYQLYTRLTGQAPRR
ncbi:MAG: FAD-binding oxidoreductase [Myxococcota bacterium]